MKILHTEDSHPHSIIHHEPPSGKYYVLRILSLARGDYLLSGVTGHLLQSILASIIVVWDREKQGNGSGSGE